MADVRGDVGAAEMDAAKVCAAKMRPAAKMRTAAAKMRTAAAGMPAAAATAVFLGHARRDSQAKCQRDCAKTSTETPCNSSEIKFSKIAFCQASHGNASVASTPNANVRSPPMFRTIRQRRAAPH
ncbi:MAG TPA: hypothetical protein VEK75_06840 [Xanthobacteraceae bacterium]|nr:hypothetical protein [Xanthobacteraceae bacterium]